MTEKTNDFPITKMEQDQEAPQGNDDSKPSAEMWDDFLDSTTLHGIRYVFQRRQTPIRLLWLVLLLTAGGYYMFTVYKAVDKYYSRPFNTVLSTKHVQEMEFPAVTICPLGMFSRRKIFMTDDDPLFVSSGLNTSSCAVTSRVRGNRPCGWSLLCYKLLLWSLDEYANCTDEYRQDLLAVMQKTGNRVNLEELYMTYSHDINALLSPSCWFYSKGSIKSCSAEDFVPMITTWGRCYTFNSGTDGKVRTEHLGVIDSGFKVTLDAQTHDYYTASFLVGFKVLVHGQGEFVNSNKGTNVGPGQQALIALSQKKVCFLVFSLLCFVC